MRLLSSVMAVLAAAACGRSEPYGREEVQPATLCQAVMGTPQLHDVAAWPLGACLDVTFAPGAEAHARGLHLALLEWAASPGTWLCFNPPMPGEPGGRAVHVAVERLDPGALSVATVTFEQGVLVAADVSFDPAFEPSHGAFLHTAGQVLGFTRTDGVESVLDARSPQEVLPALTEADRQSVAAVYPACR